MFHHDPRSTPDTWEHLTDAAITNGPVHAYAWIVFQRHLGIELEEAPWVDRGHTVAWSSQKVPADFLWFVGRPPPRWLAVAEPVLVRRLLKQVIDMQVDPAKVSPSRAERRTMRREYCAFLSALDSSPEHLLALYRQGLALRLRAGPPVSPQLRTIITEILSRHSPRG